MQLIANLPDGSSIIRVPSGWLEQISAAWHQIGMLLAQNSQPDARTASQPAVPRPAAGPVRRAQAAPSRTCKICGKAFAGRTSAKTCSPECAKENDRRSKLASKRKIEGTPDRKPRACEACGKTYQPRIGIQRWCSDCSKANSGNARRQERREALGLTKETRLEMLRRAGQRMGVTEPDPVAVIGRVADRERQACGED